MLEGSGIYLVAAVLATALVLAAYAFSLSARVRDAERDLESERGAGRR
jgi:hypothetical protein